MIRNLSKQSASQLPTVTKPGRRRRDRPVTKQATMLRLLRRRRGASMSDLINVTGWQAHSVRAALTGLRKRDIEIVCEVQGGISRYRVPTS
ncbi:MAG: DUF3489 domain-containing protein [Alphaproteobacteria bacterium]|nr:DUF3489 domain-containing protein [Alphaproteobacteria bacterium]